MPPPTTLPPGSSLEQILSTGLGRANTYAGNKPVGINQLSRDVGSTLALNLGAFGGASGAGGVPLTLANLIELLGNKGKTDPTAFNQSLTDIGQQTQRSVDSTQAGLARAGLSRSGVGQALAASQQNAGNNLRARAIGQENQLTEQRRRTDLQLAQDMLLQPMLDILALERGQALGNRQLSMQQRGQNLNTLLGAGQGIAGLFT